MLELTITNCKRTRFAIYHRAREENGHRQETERERQSYKILSVSIFNMSHKNQPQNAENCCENRKCTCRMQLGVEWQHEKQRKTGRTPSRSVCLSVCLFACLEACNLSFVALAINVLIYPVAIKAHSRLMRCVVERRYFLYSI